MNHRNNTIYRASRLLSEAFDLDDPMNEFGNAEENNGFESFDADNNDVSADEFDKLDDKDDTDQTYDVDVGNPVCPCCGARLNIVDSNEDDDETSALPDGIEAMDASLEPKSDDAENQDAYVSIDDLGSDDEEEEEEETPEEDEDEESGEKIEAF